MAYHAELAERLRRVLSQLAQQPGEELGEKKMFGGLCFTLNGKMLIGIEKERLVVRLDDADYARESEAGRALPMDFTGRPLRNFAYLAESSYAEDSDLLVWGELSAKFVREHMLSKPKAKRGK